MSKITIASFTNAIADVIATAAELKGAGSSCLAELRDNIVALSVACKDRGHYLSIVRDAFGNGKHHKAEGYVAGTVRTTLVARGYPLASVKVYLSNSRLVCDWLADTAHKTTDDKGKPLSFGQMVKAARGPAKSKDASDKPTTFDQMVASMGMGNAIKRIAAMLKTSTETKLQATALNAIAEQVMIANK